MKLDRLTQSKNKMMKEVIEIQRQKMKELWDNKEDEVWEIYRY